MKTILVAGRLAMAVVLASMLIMLSAFSIAAEGEPLPTIGGCEYPVSRETFGNLDAIRKEGKELFGVIVGVFRPESRELLALLSDLESVQDDRIDALLALEAMHARKGQFDTSAIAYIKRVVDNAIRAQESGIESAHVTVPGPYQVYAAQVRQHRERLAVVLNEVSAGLGAHLNR